MKGCYQTYGGNFITSQLIVKIWQCGSYHNDVNSTNVKKISWLGSSDIPRQVKECHLEQEK